MNFDELQKQWNSQNETDITVKPEYLEKTRSLSSKIMKGFVKEISLWIVSMVFLIIIPSIDIYRIDGAASVIYYFLLIQLFLFGLFYYRRLYTVYKMLKQPNTFNSREGVIRLYYEFLFAVESYRSSVYIMTPTGLALYFILFSSGHYEDILNKLLHIGKTYQENPSFVYIFIGLLLFIVIFVIGLSEWMIYKFYGKYIKELKAIKDEFND